MCVCVCVDVCGNVCVVVCVAVCVLECVCIFTHCTFTTFYCDFYKKDFLIVIFTEKTFLLLLGKVRYVCCTVRR